MGQRQIDMRAEQELAKFLDSHLYGQLLKEGGFLSFQRVSDVAVQKRGVDVIGTAPRATACIDEKAQLHYLNCNRPTFAFELEFLRRGQPIQGWFLNEGLLTTHYLLLWPNAATTDLTQLTSGHFTQVEGMVIAKGRLKRALDELGLHRDYLAQMAAQLRASGVVGPLDTGHQGIRFYVSDPQVYPEHPVNLVISKRRLSPLAQAHYLVTQEGLVRIGPEG